MIVGHLALSTQTSQCVIEIKKFKTNYFIGICFPSLLQMFIFISVFHLRAVASRQSLFVWLHHTTQLSISFAQGGASIVDIIWEVFVLIILCGSQIYCTGTQVALDNKRKKKKSTNHPCFGGHDTLLHLCSVQKSKIQNAKCCLVFFFLPGMS